uniref:Uncharacterized protein n=1 Tax=Ditylenchus dipsaci TaxID=166011 RepID=A0A915DL67_9BILA
MSPRVAPVRSAESLDVQSFPEVSAPYLSFSGPFPSQVSAPSFNSSFPISDSSLSSRAPVQSPALFPSLSSKVPFLLPRSSRRFIYQFVPAQSLEMINMHKHALADLRSFDDLDYRNASRSDLHMLSSSDSVVVQSSQGSGKSSSSESSFQSVPVEFECSSRPMMMLPVVMKSKKYSRIQNPPQCIRHLIVCLFYRFQ